MTASLTRFLRRREVSRATGLSKSTIYAMIAAGKFPGPVPLGEGRNSPVGWPENEVAAWQQDRMKRREGAPHQEA
jgi:prophage regulatory protein